MADFTIGPAASLQFAIDAQQTLTALGRISGSQVPEPEFPEALDLQRNRTGTPLNIRDALAAIDIALIAGTKILAALEALSDAFQLATKKGLTGPLAGLTLRGTRISGVNITSQAGRLVDAIDDLVKSAEISGANLISSSARPTTLQTTQFGGQITVSPQALDSVGLGIEDLRGITREEALSALASLGNAITLARIRLDNLGVLRNSLTPGRGISNEITRVLNSGTSGFLPLGSLVNQIA